MADAVFRVPAPVNEPIRPYLPADEARASLKDRLKSMATERVEIPLVIGGKEIRTGEKRQVTMPHSKREVLAEFHVAGEKELRAAADAAMKAKPMWEAMPWI
ncbi:MAG TPA: 1-pyrroline-5-carboxylate dehydrogenase, partial [Bdellovibrionota bacterium]|nr:1-pyrroline-5-carboxylate dehydrogenase [Bdellovibrionota bacterium]